MIRWPVVALVGALLVAGVAYDRVELVETGAPAAPFAADPNPAMAQPARLSSVWYCPVGSAVGGYADHTVEVINLGAEPAVATISMLTDTGPGPSIRLDIGPGTRRALALGELEAAPAAGAVVEVLGGDGVVDHVVATPHGPARGACATGASSEWHFAGGTSTRDATFQLALLNPFAEDAVFDVRFEATGRARTPAALQGAIVPAGSVQVIDVTQYVAREPSIATTVTLRRGRVVAERLQSFDGQLGPVGSALELGAPSATLEAWFPAGRIHDGGDQHLVLYNPSDTVAELDVSFVPFDAGLTTSFGLVPLEVSVSPGRFEVIDLVATADQLGLLLPFDTGLHVVSVNGTPVVGERWSMAPPIDRTAIGAGGGDEPADGTEGDPQPGPEGPGGEQPAPDQPDDGAVVEQATAAGFVTVWLALAAPAAEEPEPVPAPEPVEGQPAPPEGGEDVEVPVEEVPAPPDPPQPTASAGVVIDRGLVVAADRWVLPGTPMLGGEGTTLVVIGVDDASTVEVRSLLAGEASPPLTTFDLLAGQRLSVPLDGTESVSDLVIRSSGRIVAAVNLVDSGGGLAVLNGVPVLDRTGP
jgi:hypothetical protein